MSAVVTAVTVALIGALVLAVVGLLAHAHRRRRPDEADHAPTRSPAPAGWPAVIVVALLAASVALLWPGIVAPHPLPATTPAPEVPTTSAPSAGRPDAPTLTSPAWPTPGWLIAVVPVLLAVAAGLAAAIALRRAGNPPVPAEEPPDRERLATVIGAAAQEIAAADPADARAAVIACYTAMERTLRTTEAAPRPADTPEQVLHRAIAAGLLTGPAAGRLAALFVEARYSRHPFTDAQRRAAAEALAAVRAELAADADRPDRADGP
ncbi:MULTISPECIES: DUF4129 domain-containing protein [Micromonospora]|uniref:DUF4129 domain-containing protein n=1 Tax=Micromonospora solifontis TaxID=2487138 RepID=A0ABX9WCY9_9ACTN|nr:MULTISPECIES: DUF4129 domain-containing protein [Micromonospora]NES17004.1 DUF4129 domain-containing protein [Micromonospora sp. PPF5-17B]NES38417.1 DUF4129 domain-containing protein [Micromonospora solifontis]NES58715.1 DUF4129 domain-containing protein [Micromonospora sp. PPF5-6]RNL95832.1 DUF4129 domain-containing protein [Micromonospora solifontis]